MSYLLRLVVPDRPGIIGAVATALGDAGIDIVSVDVLERGGPGGRVADVVRVASRAERGAAHAWPTLFGYQLLYRLAPA